MTTCKPYEKLTKAEMCERFGRLKESITELDMFAKRFADNRKTKDFSEGISMATSFLKEKFEFTLYKHIEDDDEDK